MTKKYFKYQLYENHNKCTTDNLKLKLILKTVFNGTNFTFF